MFFLLSLSAPHRQPTGVYKNRRYFHPYMEGRMLPHSPIPPPTVQFLLEPCQPLPAFLHLCKTFTNYLRLPMQYIRTIFSFLLLFSLFSALYAQNKAIGQWSVYLPQTNATSLAITPNKLYVGTDYYLYELNKADNAVRPFSGLDGLSELGVAHLAYNSNTEALVIAYKSANFDVLRNGKITNYPDILRSNIPGAKNINHLLPHQNKVYMSCSFGIVVFNIATGQFEDTYVIGPNGSNIRIFQTAINDTYIVAATENGLYRADLSNSNLAFFSNWQLIDNTLPVTGAEVRHVMHYQNKFYAVIAGTLYQTTDFVDWEPVYADAAWCIKSAEVVGNKIVICEWLNNCTNDAPATGRVVVLNPDNTYVIFQKWNLYRPVKAAPDEWGNVWAADAFRSLVFMGENFSEQIIPDGPYATNVFGISVFDNKVWVASGGINYSNWNKQFLELGFNVYQNGDWQSYGAHNTEQLNNITDILQIEKATVPNKVFIAAYGSGLLEFDGANFTRYDSLNSTLQTTIGDSQNYRVSGLATDAAGNLWVANYGAPKPLSVRTPQGQWRAFTPPFIPFDPPNPLHQMVIDDFNQKWIVAHKTGIMVYNHGADIENTADDKAVLLKSGVGQGALPSSEVTCLAKDNNGAIWVGTSKGIGVFYCPSLIFTTGCDAIRPFVNVTGFGAYLLETEVVRAIVVDGANRKWIGTENGLWLMSADGSTPVQYFTTSNSPLLSNFITSLALDGQTGELYIGTDRGLVSYRTNATDGAAQTGNISVFPNPVRPGYEGDIAVQGLGANANVKITDISGNLVFEATANGGTVTWNGRDYTGKKAASGVYLIFAAGGNDANYADVAKLMIVR